MIFPHIIDEFFFSLIKKMLINVDALLLGSVGLVGFVISLILAAVGNGSGKIFSHVLADACASRSESPISSILAGIFAMITISFVAAFQYAFVRNMNFKSGPPFRVARIIAKIFGYASVIGFILLVAFSTAFSTIHQIVSGIGVGFALFFVLALLFLFDDELNFPRLELRILRIVVAILDFLSGISMAIFFFISFAYDIPPINLAFFYSQIAFWIFYCIFFLTYLSSVFRRKAYKWY
jgi:hypothetical protein